MKGMFPSARPNARRAIFIFGSLFLFLALLLSLFRAEENWRGKRAWEQCKSDLEARGDVLDWQKFIPPPVPDDLNFFKAPKMAEWFVKPPPGSPTTNELTTRLSFDEFSRHFPNANAMVLAELTALPSSNNAVAAPLIADIKLRYSSFGNAFFLQEDVVETNDSARHLNIPIIEFKFVPLADGIMNLARAAGIAYVLDTNVVSKSSLSQPVTTRWEGITARQALLALLNQYDLRLIDDPTTGIARITGKDANGFPVFISAEARQPLVVLLKNAVGTTVIGSQGPAFLTQSPGQVQPVRILCRSESLPPDSEMIKLFAALFPNASARLGSPRIWLKPVGTNTFRVMADAAAAGDYLAWSDGFESDFDLIREALKRPYARMDGDYSQPFAMPMPNYLAVRAVVQTLAQRAQCHLLLGQPEKALRELTLLNDSRRLLGNAPGGKPMTLVAAMINVAVSGLYAETVVDGFRLHAWGESQLTALQAQLKKINLMPSLVEALKTEPVGVCHTVLSLMASSKYSGTNFGQQIRNLRFPIIPRGWVYQNMVTVVKLDRMLLNGFDLTNDTVSPRRFNETALYVDNFLKRKSPFKLLAAVTVVNVVKAEQTTASNQTLANEAQVACALERYRLARGQYPDTLDKLVPQFIEKLPHDIIGGGPLHYRRDPPPPGSDAAGGNFLLYSVGWNETDDGGEVALKEDGSEDREKGDWVWRNQPQINTD